MPLNVKATAGFENLKSRRNLFIRNKIRPPRYRIRQTKQIVLPKPRNFKPEF